MVACSDLPGLELLNSGQLGPSIFMQRPTCIVMAIHYGNTHAFEIFWDLKFHAPLHKLCLEDELVTDSCSFLPHAIKSVHSLTQNTQLTSKKGHSCTYKSNYEIKTKICGKMHKAGTFYPEVQGQEFSCLHYVTVPQHVRELETILLT